MTTWITKVEQSTTLPTHPVDIDRTCRTFTSPGPSKQQRNVRMTPPKQKKGKILIARSYNTSITSSRRCAWRAGKEIVVWARMRVGYDYSCRASLDNLVDHASFDLPIRKLRNIAK